MNRVERLLAHEDARGTLYEVYRTAGRRLPIHEVYWVTLRPSAVRAGHYHRKKHEYVLVVQGSVKCLLYRPSGTILERLRLGPRRELLHIAPGLGHQFANGDSNDAHMLILSTTRFNAARPDKVPARPTVGPSVEQSSNLRRGHSRR